MKRGTTTWGAATTKPKPGVAMVAVTPERLRQLVSLCHPDRHHGSALATDVSQWLQELKRKGLDT